MAGRQAHGSAPSKKAKSKADPKKRSRDAFAIALQQNPDKVKIRQHRLGAAEGGNRPGKRGRRPDSDDDEDEDEDETRSKKQKKGPPKGRFDELDQDQGSDSEGNEWRLGQVDSDDDSDLDSDEAFGESDEERYEGFSFGGSAGGGKKKKQGTLSKNVNLVEDEQDTSDSELEEGDLGEDAIDLAAMLDATENDSDVDDAIDEDEGSSGESESDESENSSVSSFGDDEEADPDKLAALQGLIASLPQDDVRQTQKQQRSDGASEYNTPSDFGLTSKNKLTLEDLGLPSINDPHIRKSLKMLAAKTKAGNRNGVSGKLEVPLARREQDRLDRAAAYDKSKETLDRWTDTVKNNRRAEHLSFPLPDPESAASYGNTRLQPTTNAKPFNDLESTIQSILEESGLATANGKDAEDKIREFEELETNKMSVEEVKARRDQLRIARDLMFREEARSKRVKKIKSRSYRKVHRKQKEKEERLNQEALAEAGIEPDEDEQEEQDRRRAEERMGSKHRGSKWAQAVKATGRAAWDDDARAGVTEMARRDEELRKRVEGRSTRKEGDADSEFSSESEIDSEDDDTESRMTRLLARVSAPADEDGGSKLANMKFMRNADASRRRENDAAVEQIRKEMDGESSEDQEESDIGRRTYGPGVTEPRKISKQLLDEFEEPLDSDAEDEDVKITLEKPAANVPRTSNPATKSKSARPEKATGSITYARQEENPDGGAWSRAVPKNKRERKNQAAAEIEDLDLSAAAVMAPVPKQKSNSKRRSKPTTQTLDLSSEDDPDEDEEADAARLPFALRDQELIKRAFAGADVVGDFEAEKRQTVADEDDKIVDNTLPGWGSWTGDGLSKKAKSRGKGRFLVVEKGVNAGDRRDGKLERVIINEKTVKKVNFSSLHLPWFLSSFSTFSSLCLEAL